MEAAESGLVWMPLFLEMAALVGGSMRPVAEAGRDWCLLVVLSRVKRGSFAGARCFDASPSMLAALAPSGRPDVRC